MKIICLTGIAGAGKSTARDTLAKLLPDCMVVGLDDIWVSSLFYFEKKFTKLFGVVVDKEKPRETWVNTMGTTGYDLFRKWVDIVTPFVVDNIKQIITTAKCKLKPPQFIIFDFWQLPEMSIWHTSDYRIVIRADEEKRVAMRRERNIIRWRKSLDESIEAI